MVQIKLTTVSPWCIFRSADFVVLYWYCTTFSILIRLTNSLVYVLPHWLCCTIYWLVYWLDWLMMYGMFHLTDCVVLYWYCTSVLKRLTTVIPWCMFRLTDCAVHYRMYQTLQLWVQEPMLHDSKLYLPALPQQYQADRLLQLFQNQKVG